MTAIDAGLLAGKIAVEIDVDRPRNVSRRVLACAPAGIVQLEAAIDHDERRLVKT